MEENPYAPRTQTYVTDPVLPEQKIQVPPQTWQYNEAWQQAYNLHQQGVPAAAIYEQMISAGMNPTTAQQILNSIIHSQPQGVPSARAKSTRNIVGGIILILVGVLLIGITASNRSSTGFIYGFTPTIYGGWLLIKGLSNK